MTRNESVQVGGKVRRTKSAEDFVLAFGNVDVDYHGPDVSTTLAPAELDELADFSEYWEDSGLPPKGPPTVRSSSFKLSSNGTLPPVPSRSMLSGATSPTEAATDSGTQASESWTGTGGDDHISLLSNDTDDCDTASRSSVKRRRTAAASATSSLAFQPLGPVKEGSADESDVRPWKVDIPDHDVVLGDTHEPTWGTKIYRQVRKPYAKKTITNEQLKTVKVEFQRRLEKELGTKLAAPPVFWCNKESKNKTKQFPVSGFLKNRPGITYSYAKDQAIKDDIKNASARSRTRAFKHFVFKGSLDEVIHKAMEACENWVGDDIDKELYAKGFKEDIERMAPWRGEYVRKMEGCEQRAMNERAMKGTHMREARIHESHVSHLEIAMVDMINQLGNMMIESYRADSKKTSRSDTFSTGDSSTGAASSRNSKTRLHGESRRQIPKGVSFDKQKSMPSLSAKDSGKKSPKEQESKTSFRPIDDFADMDLSPIDVRKGKLSETLEVGGHALNGNPRRDLSSLFSQNLRVGSLEDLGNPSEGDVVVMPMPPGVPREVRPGAPDELSVISAPDDMSLAFMEARESAIRRGIDQPAALPQPGHVADRTKALLQQMKNRKDSK